MMYCFCILIFQITESKTVDQSNFEEPVLTKLILEQYVNFSK